MVETTLKVLSVTVNRNCGVSSGIWIYNGERDGAALLGGAAEHLRFDALLERCELDVVQLAEALRDFIGRRAGGDTPLRKRRVVVFRVDRRVLHPRLVWFVSSGCVHNFL